jgi:hypothetical protein
LRKIAHRGNTNGPSIHENQPWYLEEAMDKGYDVEIDIWKMGQHLWAGHDHAMYLITEDFLLKNILHIWIHCKNFEALDHFAKMGNSFNYFWHQEDDFTMTSQNYVWTYPGKQVGDWSVIVDLKNSGEYDCFGICTDYLDNK